MDLLAVYGLMVVGALVCLAASVFAAVMWAMVLSETNYDVPKPWELVALMTTIALPVVAVVGAAVLIGPSSDLGNFIRAVGGVLAGVATYFVLAFAGIPKEPQQFKVVLQDGRVLTDTEAKEHYARRPGDHYPEIGWGRVPGWRPSETFIARFVLFPCILPPVAGVVVAYLIARWL